MISKDIVQMIRNTVAFTFVLTATAAFTQAQTDNTSANLQKESIVKSFDKIKDSEIKQKTPGTSADLAEVKNEKPETPAVILSTRFDMPEIAKNPFSKIVSEKPASPGKQTSGSEWQFAFAPYLFASGVSGTVGARGRTIEIDASFGNVFENLDIGLMGTFEAKKGKLILLSDLIWVKMSAERDTPGDLFSSAKIGVNLFIFDPEVGYRLIEKPAGSLDVLGGVRIWSVENNLNFRSGILPGFDVSTRKTWAAPVVGLHGILNLSPKFYLTSKVDIGGGIGADFTGQFFGGAGYRIKPNIALIAGYRFLHVDYDDNNGFIFDTNMSGLMFGAKFSF